MDIFNRAFNFIGKIIVNLFLILLTIILLTIILNPFSALTLFIGGILIYSIFGLMPLILIILIFLIIFQIINKTTNNS